MMKTTWHCVLILLSALMPNVRADEQPAMPTLSKVAVVQQGPLAVEAGQQWSARVAVPEMADDERPVLSLRAYAQAGGGCNYVLQVLVDGVPLTESPLRRRLLNKLPWFDPPGTEYHFAWYDPTLHRWMTMFGQDEPIIWGGTGRDTEFVFDLSGLVAGGKSAAIGFAHTMPNLPGAIKSDRAPMVLNDVKLGVVKQAEADRLRRCVEAADAMKPAPVRPDLLADAKPGPRPYEVEWSGRQESPRAQAAFDDLAGWTLSVNTDVPVSLDASVARRLWRKQLAKLSYSDGSKPTTILLRPPKPILIEGPFDAANMWLFADFKRMEDKHPQVAAYLEDSAGREFAIDLGQVHNSYWVLLHGVLGRQSLSMIKFPARFVGLSVFIHPVKGKRALYLESLAFYERNRKPFVENTRPPHPSFPTSDEGMLPTPPADARVRVEASGQGAMFVSESAEGTLRFQVDPEKGLLNGVRARWRDGAWFQPMAEGDIKLDLLTEKPAARPEVLSSKIDGNRFVVRWRRGVEYQATYSLRGRTLVVDVECKGGAAEGLRFGQVAGLPNARSIEAPYLTYGGGYGPFIACGGGLFASVFADWYHCDCSVIDGNVPRAKEGCVGLMAGTDYRPLTDGRRNDLRDRALITVSPEFADVLPNIPHPPSPHMERLAPYVFVMVGHIRPTYFKTLKQYGIDHVIACDFARFYVQDFAEGFAGRWRPHPSLTMKQIQDYRKEIKDLGYLFGAYSDLRDWFPLNEFWDENCVSLDLNGDLVDAWYGNLRTKPNYLPVLARLVGEKVHEHYPADSVYMDTHSCVGPHACDYEAAVPGAGKARDQIFFNGDCMLETRKWYGTVMSEGRVRWMYAGIADMDYASPFLTRHGNETPPLVDFDLLKIHPLNLGTMMGYGPSIFFGRDKAGQERGAALYRDSGAGPAPIEFYQYVSASLAYGHMLMTGYSYDPPLSRMIQLYTMMQGVQKEYLTDRVAEIRYHNGREFVSTSAALLEDTQKLGRVRVRYSRGLTVHVNYNPDQNWRVDEYDLPPFGWLITKPNEVLAFSALIDGRRVDYVRCPDYVYIHTGDKPAKVEALTVQGAVWVKREAGGWRLIPCGDLGKWESFSPPGLPDFMKDFRLSGTPPERGCGEIVIGTRALMNKAPASLVVEARSTSGQTVPATTQVNSGLKLVPAAEAVDYMLK